MKFLKTENRNNVKGDLYGGFLAAVIGLPMGLAFGVQSGLGAQAGIYSAIILAFIAGMIGGTRTLISDPTGPMTVVAATVISLGMASIENLSLALPLILGTFLMAGFFELIFGLLNFGKFVKLIPYPVVSSFMAGIGLIIISMQLFPILGFSSPKGILNIFQQLDQVLLTPNFQCIGLAALTLFIIYLLPLLSKKVPSILVALISLTILAQVLNLNVPVIGAIPQSLPEFHLAAILDLRFTDLRMMLAPAILLGGLGVIDSLLTSVVADNLTKTSHDSRRTIIGQGIGNMVVALFGGIPGAGATMGTVTNIKGGGTSKLSSMAKAVFLLVIVVGFANFVSLIPMAVLAGILVHIGISIIDFKGVKMLHKIPRQDAAVWIIVLLITLFDNLLNAVAAGFTLACILFIARMSKGMSNTQSKVRLKDLVKQEIIPTELAETIYVQNIDGPIFFGFANQYREFCSRLNNMMIVIIRMENIPFIDQSGLLTLEDVVKDWYKRGIQVYLTGANQEVLNLLDQVNIVPNLVSKEFCFDSFSECVAVIAKKIEDKEELIEFEEVLLDRRILNNRMPIAV